MGNTGFATISLAEFASDSERARQDLAGRVDRICRNVGFLAVADHGISKSLIRQVWKVSRAFFDLPLEEKLRVRRKDEQYPYGYFPFENETLARSRGDETPPDLKESFSIGPLSRPPETLKSKDADFYFAPNLWPKIPTDFEAVWIDYYRNMNRLAQRLMQVFAYALGLNDDFFDGKTDRSISAMRALNYPAVDKAPLPGQLRAGAHTDYGSLTILLPDATYGGLEIQTPSGKWQRVPDIADAFIVNLGDLMARWTNDRWVSTMHRVATPPPDARGSTRRQSIVFFQQPNWDAEISCIPTCLSGGEAPKYQPVRSGPHLLSKFLRSVDSDE